jgi:hypothetical protein
LNIGKIWLILVKLDFFLTISSTVLNEIGKQYNFVQLKVFD